MNKARFLAVLRQRLSQLPQAEIDKSCAYYEEMIDDRIEDGMTEEEAVASLEDMDTIVQRILQDTPLTTLVASSVRPKGGWSTLAIILAIVGFPIWLPILIAVFAVVLSLYVVVWSVLIAFIAVTAALILGGIGLIVAGFLSIGKGFLPMLGGGFIMIGIGVLCVLGVKYAVTGTIRMSASIGRGVKNLFIRKDRG